MVHREETVWRQWLLTLLACLPMLNYGISAGWMSSAGRELTSERSPAGYPLTADTVSWMASSLPLVAVVGSLVAAKLADRIGRKWSLMLLSVPQAIAWIMKASSAQPGVLLAARLLIGLSAGGVFVVPQMYSREISSEHLRGALGSLSMVLHNLGLLYVYILASLLDYFTIIFVVLPMPFIHLMFSVWALESPAYLVKRGKKQEAREAAAWLRGLDPEDKEIVEQISALEAESLELKQLPNMSLRTILSDVARRRGFLLCLFMFTVQAGGGCYAVLSYAASILESSGTDSDPDQQAVAVGILFLLGSAISLPLFMLSATSLTASLIVLGTPALLNMLGLKVAPPSWLPVLGLAAAVFSFSIGLSSTVYVFLSEIFSFEVRATLSGLVVMYAWFISFAQLVVFNALASALGMACFLPFAALNLLGVFVCARYMPETRGRTLREIEERLRGNWTETHNMITHT